MVIGKAAVRSDRQSSRVHVQVFQYAVHHRTARAVARVETTRMRRSNAGNCAWKTSATYGVTSASGCSVSAPCCSSGRRVDHPANLLDRRAVNCRSAADRLEAVELARIATAQSSPHHPSSSGRPRNTGVRTTPRSITSQPLAFNPCTHQAASPQPLASLQRVSRPRLAHRLVPHGAARQVPKARPRVEKR